MCGESDEQARGIAKDKITRIATILLVVPIIYLIMPGLEKISNAWFEVFGAGIMIYLLIGLLILLSIIFGIAIRLSFAWIKKKLPKKWLRYLWAFTFAAAAIYALITEVRAWLEAPT